MSEIDIPPEDEYLVHYGVKGMRWGHRKPDDSGSSSTSSKSSSGSSRQGLSSGQKKALKYAAGGALAIGAVAGVAILARNGNIPISSLQKSAFNKNSLAAETKRMAKIPGTLASGSKPSTRPSVSAAGAKEAAIRSAAAAKRQSMAETNVANELKRRQVVMEKGKASVEAIQAANALKQSMADFRKQIEEDHKEQTKRMIQNQAGAGGYNPSRDNEFTPEARKNR